MSRYAQTESVFLATLFYSLSWLSHWVINKIKKQKFNKKAIQIQRELGSGSPKDTDEGGPGGHYAKYNTAPLTQQRDFLQREQDASRGENGKLLYEVCKMEKVLRSAQHCVST